MSAAIEREAGLAAALEDSKEVVEDLRRELAAVTHERDEAMRLLVKTWTNPEDVEDIVLALIESTRCS